MKKNYTDLRNISDSLNVKTFQPKLPGNLKHPGILRGKVMNRKEIMKVNKINMMDDEKKSHNG